MSIGSSDLVFDGGGGRRRTAVVRRNARAKSVRLRVDPRDGRVVLTLPARASERRALRWAEAQRPWVEAQLAGLSESRPIAAGSPLPFRGDEVVVDWSADRPRTPRLDGATLSVGGPEAGLANRVLRWLREEARARLTEETLDCARRAGVSIDRIAIGDARTRWGSCSSSGTIRYNWRLVLAPPRVLSATVAHEVAHRVHFHHGPEFHALVERLFGADPAPERRWLREHGSALYWVGCPS